MGQLIGISNKKNIITMVLVILMTIVSLYFAKVSYDVSSMRLILTNVTQQIGE